MQCLAVVSSQLASTAEMTKEKKQNIRAFHQNKDCHKNIQNKHGTQTVSQNKKSSKRKIVCLDISSRGFSLPFFAENVCVYTF